MMITETLALTHDQYFKIVYLCDVQELHCCHTIKIFLYDSSNSYLLYDNDTDGLYQCMVLLEKAIKNTDGCIDIANNIGYIWNEYLQDNIESTHINDFLLWESPSFLIEEQPKVASWLYKKADSIVLEITPIYKWHFKSPGIEENYETYEEFIKKYHSLLALKIDEKNVYHLLERLSQLVNTIENNKKSDFSR